MSYSFNFKIAKEMGGRTWVLNFFIIYLCDNNLKFSINLSNEFFSVK